MRNVISKNMLKKKNRSSSSSTITTIQSLPKDLLVEIVASVASHSSDDLFNVKKSCKDLLDAGKDNYVYRRISLDKFPFTQWERSPTTDKLLLFLKRCKENQNTESLYREGLRECLGNNGNMEEGLKNLDMAAKEGHKEAKYVYGMILLCSSSWEDEKSVESGLGHLRFLRESKCVVRTRNKVEELVRYMWRNHGLFSRENRKLRLCPFKSTCKGWKLKEGVWTLHDEDDDDIVINSSCEYCRWEYELKFFYDLI